MTQIPDDPIIRCIERTGHPPWHFRYGRLLEDCRDDDEPFEEDCDVYYGNETESF